MDAKEINKEIQLKNDLRELISLCKVVIDQKKMGENYLILFVKRDTWNLFESCVREIDGKLNQ